MKLHTLAGAFGVVGFVACVPEIHLAAGDATTDISLADGATDADALATIDTPAQRPDTPDAADSATDAFDAQPDATDATDAADVVLLDAVDVTDVAPVDACPVCALAHADASCRAGACAIDRCATGYGDCDGSAANGCERALGTLTDCGGCGMACRAGATCMTNRCVDQRSCPDASERGCGVVEVEGATFTMGGEAGASVGLSAQPNITVSALAIDSHEATIARFRRFWNAAHPSPGATVNYPSGPFPWSGSVRQPSTAAQCNWSDSASIRELHPVNCVDWSTAQAFCVWDGGRLPTDAEWEFVARGRRVGSLTVPRSYPWGNEAPVTTRTSANCDRAQLEECPGDDSAGTRRVGSFPPNAAVYDLIGNVHEWTADYFPTSDVLCWDGRPAGRTNPLCSHTDENRTTRGAAWMSEIFAESLAASRARRPLGTQSTLVGFRCVRSR